MSTDDAPSTGVEPPEESAEDLYEHAPCGYISTRPDGLIIKVNQTFLAWTGYTREELLGRKRFSELLTVAGRIFHETHYAPLLRMQGFVRELSLELLGADGRQLPVLLNTVQRKDAAGKPLYHRTTLFNATERKLYERELLQARRKAEQLAQSRSDLLATISHEIRNPLNAFTAATKLLARTELSGKQVKYVHILSTASGNLLDLVNNILDWSKIEAGKLTLEERPFDPREFVCGIVNGLAARAEEKGLALRVDVDERLPDMLLGDPVKVGQVLTNLVSNALKFTEKGSVTVGVTARSRDASTCTVDFRVSDTGIGIAPERVNAIFEEYTQASYDIGLKYGGTGLGLSISRKLLELHGSRMHVESVQGQGTRFSFELRLKVGERAPESAPPAAPAPESALSGLRVLVAEDSEINLYVLTRLLERWGVSFDAVQSGQQAVERIREGDYELVLMDLHMPGLGGYDAVRAIRQLPDERFQRLPIIAISASARVWEQGRGGASGFSDFIGKPFDPDLLFRRMAHHTSRELPAPVARPEEQPAPRAPEPGPAPLPLVPDFSLAKLEQRASGDAQARAALARVTLLELEQARQPLRAAVSKGDLPELERWARQLVGPIRLLEAHSLAVALRRASRLLTAKAHHPARVQSAMFTLEWELDTLAEALTGLTNLDT